MTNLARETFIGDYVDDNEFLSLLKTGPIETQYFIELGMIEILNKHQPKSSSIERQIVTNMDGSKELTYTVKLIMR